MLPPFANISHSSFRRNPACCATSVNSRIGLFPYCCLHYLFTVRRTIDCTLSLSKSKNQSSAISCLHEKRRSLPPCVPYVTKWLFFLLIIYFVSWFFYLTQSTVPTAASHSYSTPPSPTVQPHSATVLHSLRTHSGSPHSPSATQTHSGSPHSPSATSTSIYEV